MDKHRNMFLQAAGDQGGSEQAGETEATEAECTDTEATGTGATESKAAEIKVEETKATATNATETKAAETRKVDPSLIQAELKAAAALAGVPKEKIPYVMRLAEVKGDDTEGADLEKLAEEAIGKVLADIPELAGMQSGTGSTGNFRRAAKAAKDAFERGFDGG